MAFSIYDFLNFTLKYLKVCNYDKRDSPRYSTINIMTKIKYLGLIPLMFDYNMRWDMHVLNIITRLMTITFKLYGLNKIISNDTMRIVYISQY